MKQPIVAADSNQSATISCGLALFIRLLEIAREDLKDDASLHYLVERCSEQQAIKGDKPLTMDDYEIITKPPTSVMSALYKRL